MTATLLPTSDPTHTATDEFEHILKTRRTIRDLSEIELSVKSYRERAVDRRMELGISIEAYVQKLIEDPVERDYVGGPLGGSNPIVPDRATLYRWQARRDDPVKLARRPGGIGTRCKILNWQAAMILEKLFYCWDARPSYVCGLLDKFARHHGYTSPSYSTVRRFIKSIKARGGLVDMMNQFRRGRYYEKYRLAVRHFYGHSNEIWETDATHLRLRVWDELASDMIEPQLLLTIDCHSGLPMGWTLVPSDPNSADNILHFRTCFLPKIKSAFWGGFPEIVQSDNAKIYESGDMMAMCEEAGIKLRKSPPHCPSANGMIERLNQTVKDRFRDGFVDHIRKRRKLNEWDMQFVGTMESLQAHLDEWMIEYARTHKRRGDEETVLERWHSGLRNPEDAQVNEAEVEAACLVTHQCPLTREGVNIVGQMFIAPELAPSIGRKKEIPVRVNVAGDPKIVIARIDEIDIRLVRNLDADGTLADFCKKPSAASKAMVSKMTKALRESGKRNMVFHTPHTAADMKLPRPKVRKEASQNPQKIVLPQIRKSSIPTNQ